MEGLLFNVNNGYGEVSQYALVPLLTSLPSPPRSYIEGIVRVYRNGLLTSTNYTNMTQCENIDGSHPLPRRSTI
jgi:V-type H+-transporting ATPase subunit d